MMGGASGDQAGDPVDILYVIGPGHCGSTLLNLCLDRHSQIMGVSEIVTLNRHRPGFSGDENVLNIPFWAEVDRVMRGNEDGALTQVPFNFRRIRRSEWSRALFLNQAAARAALGVSGKRILADASKQTHRLAALLESPLFRVKVIYLVRDGRAVVHAYRRKYGTGLPGWRKLIRIDRAARHMMARHGSHNWLTIRYEDMVTDLEATLGQICHFVGVDFEAAMMEPDTAAFNGLGGNRLRKRPVEHIELDTAWRTEMTGIVRSATAAAAAGFNARHGYSD